MKIKAFLDVSQKFWHRAELFFPKDDFAKEVRRLSAEVRRALWQQIGYAPNPKEAVLPPDVEMCEKAVKALERLCEYLDKMDHGVNYRQIMLSA